MSEVYVAVDECNRPVVIAFDEVAFQLLVAGLPVIEELEDE